MKENCRPTSEEAACSRPCLDSQRVDVDPSGVYGRRNDLSVWILESVLVERL